MDINVKHNNFSKREVFLLVLILLLFPIRFLINEGPDNFAKTVFLLIGFGVNFMNN